MAMLQPFCMQADATDPPIEYSAQDYRNALTASIYSREGVIAPELGELRVSQRGAGANMSVDIAAGTVVIEGDDVSDQGKYIQTSTATENRDTFSDGTAISAPGSGTRTHRVVAQVRDKLHNGMWTGYDWEFLVLQDTGSGTPAVPGSAVHLAYVVIAAGQASITDGDIIDDRPRASVGTPWLAGDLLESGISPSYGGRDASRPLTYQKSPDGFITLSGWIRRSAADTSGSQGTLYWFDGAGSGTNPLLPLEARPTGVRDVPAICSEGPMQYVILTNGAIGFRAATYAYTLRQNLSWFSFDGVTFRATTFS